MKQFKRTLAMVLSVAMMLQIGAATVMAQAQEAPVVDSSVVMDSGVVEIEGGNKYATLQEAFDAAADGKTVKLLTDIDLGDSTATIPDISVTLDLNGQTLTSSTNITLRYSGVNGKPFTIKDSSTSGTGTVKNTGGVGTETAIFNVSTGTVIVSGGTVESTGFGIDNDTGTVQVTGGTVRSKSSVAINNNSAGTVLVSDGTVSSQAGTAIFNASDGTVTVSGGTVSSQAGIAIWNASAGTVTVSDGTVSSQADTAILNPSDGTVRVTGGTVTSQAKITIFNMFTGTVTVSGGTVESTSNYSTGIANISAGTVTVSGGTVEGTGEYSTGIGNTSTGTVTVSGGTVEGTHYGIRNASTGTVIVSGGGTVSSNGATTIANDGAGLLEITGGTVNGIIDNFYDGTVTISGGTVNGGSDPAIICSTKSTITISGATTRITSAVTGGWGTVLIYNDDNINKLVLDVQGGTIENTAIPEGYSIYCDENITPENFSTFVRLSPTATVGKILPTPTPTPGGGGGSSGGGSGSGSGGGGKSSILKPSASQTTPGKSLTANAAAKAVQDAIAAGNTSATLKNVSTLTPDALKSITDTSKGANLKVSFDTVANRAVTSRITVNTADLAKVMTENLPLGVSHDQKSASVKAVLNTFEKYFDNKIVAVTFEQKAPLGVNAEFCAKLDLSGLNTKTLQFYSYNPVTNAYTLIANANFWVDKNGYAHITAPLGGSVIITDQPLTKK